MKLNKYRVVDCLTYNLYVPYINKLKVIFYNKYKYMNGTGAVRFGIYDTAGEIYRILRQAINLSHLTSDEYSEENNIEVVYWWIGKNKPEIVNQIDREVIRTAIRQYKQRSEKIYEVNLYLAMFKEKNDTVDTIMKKLEIDKNDTVLRLYIQKNI